MERITKFFDKKVTGVTGKVISTVSTIKRDFTRRSKRRKQEKKEKKQKKLLQLENKKNDLDIDVDHKYKLTCDKVNCEYHPKPNAYEEFLNTLWCPRSNRASLHSSQIMVTENKSLNNSSTDLNKDIKNDSNDDLNKEIILNKENYLNKENLLNKESNKENLSIKENYSNKENLSVKENILSNENILNDFKDNNDFSFETNKLLDNLSKNIYNEKDFNLNSLSEKNFGKEIDDVKLTLTNENGETVIV